MISYMRYLFLELLAYCELPESPWRRFRAGGADTELEGVGSSGEQQEATRTKAHGRDEVARNPLGGFSGFSALHVIGGFNIR